MLLVQAERSPHGSTLYPASREQCRKHNTGKIGLNRAKSLIEKAIIRNPIQTTRWSNGVHETENQENRKRNLLHTKPINQTTKNPIQGIQTKMENKQKRENTHPRRQIVPSNCPRAEGAGHQGSPKGDRTPPANVHIILDSIFSLLLYKKFNISVP